MSVTQPRLESTLPVVDVGPPCFLHFYLATDCCAAAAASEASEGLLDFDDGFDGLTKVLKVRTGAVVAEWCLLVSLHSAKLSGGAGREFSAHQS